MEPSGQSSVVSAQTPSTSGSPEGRVRLELSIVLRARAAALQEGWHSDEDDAELLRVLARVCEGTELMQAFGSPGAWGCNTRIGQALATR